jgi:hypothetical protein
MKNLTFLKVVISITRLIIGFVFRFRYFVTFFDFYKLLKEMGNILRRVFPCVGRQNDADIPLDQVIVEDQTEAFYAFAIYLNDKPLLCNQKTRL